MRKLLLASAATLLAAGTAFAQPVKPVAAPGTIVVHLNGYLQFGFGAYGAGSAMKGGSVAAGTAYKLSDTGTFGDVRIYPGFDAETVNGIWYGAQVELRTLKANAGAGKNNNSVATTTSSSSGYSALYVQRAYGYIGTPDYGYARFGQTDSVFSLLQQGVIENFGDGAQWNVDGGQYLLYPSAAAPGNFVYADQSALYSTDKIVYLTPSVTEQYLGGSFFGGLGFEPNSNGIKQGYASGGSDLGANDSSIPGATTALGINNRRRNTIDVALGYNVKIDTFANKFSISYLHGSPLGTTNGYPTSAKYGYDELSVFQAGAQTTWNGLTVGGNIKEGQTEDSYAFKPKGARNALTYIVGASYTNGPFILGASYYDGQTSGGYVPGGKGIARTLNEYGVAVGGNYLLAKPLSLWIQYEYGSRHQPGNTAISASGNEQVNSIAVGTTIKW